MSVPMSSTCQISFQLLKVSIKIFKKKNATEQMSRQQLSTDNYLWGASVVEESFGSATVVDSAPSAIHTDVLYQLD
jgi:hypothetical protein